jgi:electron transfer flavoprotein alpha subunit
MGTETMAKILVVAGWVDGALEPGFYDTLACAIRIAAGDPKAIRVLLLGEAVEAAARKITTLDGIDVTAISDPGLATYTCAAFRQVLLEEIGDRRPAYALTPHTSRGMEWAPALAAELGCGCISGIDEMTADQDGVRFHKDLCGGKVKGIFAPTTDTTFLTIQPGAFKYRRPAAVRQGQLETKSVRVRQGVGVHLGSLAPPGRAADLSAAAIIVAAGNGIGTQENLALIHDLAARLPQATVAGTRILCDRGWLDYQQQVGITGATVAPSLYIACGISGATQHRAGMRGSQLVVAINTDPGAPIFNEADVCIVEDVGTFIPLLLEMLFSAGG